MPQEVPELAGRRIVFEEGETVITKAVDISDLCRGDPRRRKFIEFVLLKDEPTVVFMECYPGESFYGVYCLVAVHFVRLQIGPGAPATSAIPTPFRRRADDFGIQPERLRDLVRDHNPFPSVPW